MDSDVSQFRYDYDLEKLQLITTMGRDFRMLVTPRFVEHYGENVFEGFSCDLLLNYCRNGVIFIDIGAHYGFYTLLVATSFPGCRVIALEPVPENYAVLERNVALNGLKNVELHNLAVSDGEGSRKFMIVEASDSCGFYDHPLTRTVKEIEVQTVSIDGFLDPPPEVPVIIKIDTEGHETAVLRGMQRLLKNNAEVKLLLEFNPKCLRNASCRPEQLLEEISALSFDIYAVDERNRVTYRLEEKRFDRWAEYLPDGNETSYCNLLCLKKERSLSVCLFAHSSNLGGAERSLLELVSELVQDHGTLCTVVVPGNLSLPEKLARAGASVVKTDYSWWWHAEDTPPEQITALYAAGVSEVAYLLERTLRKINPHLLYTSTMTIPWGAVAASLLGKPHVWHIHELGDRAQPVKALLPLEETTRFIDRLSSAIVVNSHYVRKGLFGDGCGERILTAYNHVAIPEEALGGHEEPCFERMGATKLIAVGPVIERKGQREAILAVRELVRRGRNVELVIMGFCETKFAAELRKLVEEEELEEYVKFTGFKENPYPAMNLADIVLQCSRFEAFGRVTLEGMLLKKPVIASRDGGTVELVQDGFNGLLYTPGDHRQLAAHIEYLMDHPEEAKRLGENGFRFAKETFTKEQFGGRIHGLLMKLKSETDGISQQEEFRIDGRTVLRGLLEVAVADNPRIKALLMGLCVHLAEKERRITELTTALQESEERTAQLDSQVAQLKYDLDVRVEQITELNIRVAALQDIIRQIERRMVIRFADRYRQAVERLLPAGTGRRRLHDMAMRGLRTMVNEGWEGLRKRCKMRM